MTNHSYHNLTLCEPATLCLCGDPLDIEDIQSVAYGAKKVSITDSGEVRTRMKLAEDAVSRAVDEGQKIYGITTGFGGMADLPVSSADAGISQQNLLEFLSCSTGKPIPKEHVRATMLLRANMLLRGASGVRMEIVERLVAFLNEDLTPVVGELGSIGASGDLVPLAVIARAITGQAAPCQITTGSDREISRDEALQVAGLKPIELQPKEGLAIVNGTTFSTAIAANNLHSAKNILGISFAAHAMMAKALLAHEDPFASFVHRCKPHRGQIWSAEMMRDLLDVDYTRPSSGNHLQDRYSIRCLPQYMGPIVDGMLRVEETIETEMNSITDNPLIDTGCDRFYQSGNFLGQYIGMAMDDLRKYLGLIAKHLDVQIALLVSPEFNHGLPASLTQQGSSPIDMNLKGLQILGNSIMPMITHLGKPLVDDFPTHAEQYNQNINGLSWGAANLASQSVDLSNRYAAVSLIFAVQAVDLRSSLIEDGNFDGRTVLSSMLEPVYHAVYDAIDRKPGAKAPLISNETSNSLEPLITSLYDSISEQGELISAVSPVVDSFNDLNLV